MMVIPSHSLLLTSLSFFLLLLLLLLPSPSLSPSLLLPSSLPPSSLPPSSLPPPPLLPPSLSPSLSRCALPSVTKEVLFLNFYADWCRFSQQLKPIFDKAASTLQTEYPVGHVTNPLPCYHVVMVTSQIHCHGFHYHGNSPTWYYVVIDSVAMVTCPHSTMLSLILLPWYHEP